MTELCSACGELLLDDEIEESQKKELIPLCFNCIDEMEEDELEGYKRDYN